MVATKGAMNLNRGNHESLDMNIRGFAEGGGFAQEIQPRCSRDADEMRPRCSRDAAEMQPRLPPVLQPARLLRAGGGSQVDSDTFTLFQEIFAPLPDAA